MVPPTKVVSTSIWCICWKHHACGRTHPWRVSIVSHGLICIKASLHWILTMLLFLLEFHLITIQAKMHSCSKNRVSTRQHRNNPTSARGRRGQSRTSAPEAPPERYVEHTLRSEDASMHQPPAEPSRATDPRGSTLTMDQAI